MPLQKRSTDVYATITPLYMPLQKGATDIYETLKSSNDSQEDEEEGYEDVIPSDTRAEETESIRNWTAHSMELSPVGLLLVLILCSYSGHTAGQGTSKAVLVLDPDQTQFYRGESVTLRCSIEGQDTSGWKFLWRRDGRNYPQQGWSDKNEYTTQLLDVSHSVEYICHGVKDKEYSEWSKRVKLQVSALPTPTVTIEPESSVYVGERVTLKCEIQPESDWTYKWFKGSISYHLSQPDTSTLSITAAAKSDESRYWCQGEMRGRAVSSLMSGHVYIFVKELKATRQPIRKEYFFSPGDKALPTATVTVESPEGPYYPGDEVTLRCDIAEHTGWNWYYWRRGNDNIPKQNKQSITIAHPDQAGQYQYTCEGSRQNRPKTSQRSTPVSVSVRAFPVPTLTVQPSPVFTGETVTLTCGIQPSSGWTYQWNILGSIKPSETNTYTINRATVSDQGEYWCYGVRERSRKSTYYSSTVQFTVNALPLATLTVEPQSPVFTRENVTLKCVIESLSGWTYKWYKESSRTPVSEGNTFTIRGAAESHKGQYWCQGERRDRPTSSKPSKRTTIVVKAPKPKLTLSPGHQLLTGDSVTLRCELGVSSGLVFYWYRHTQTSDPVAQTVGNSYSISSDKVSDGGQYWCRAGRGDPVFYTQYSDTAEIKLIGVSLASVIIHSNWTQIFTSEPLSLSCGVQGNSTGWRLRWFTGRGGESKCPTDWRSETGSSCSISSASPSDSGVYWCQSESGERSNPVNITVHKGDVILETPVHPVTEGDPLTLRCRYRYQPSNISADFYKDGTLLQTSTTGEMAIPAVSKSHEGLYKCSNPERGVSPESWVTVRVSGSGSSMLVVGVSVVIGLLIAFALVISLVMLYSYKVKNLGSGTVKRNLDQQLQTTNQSSEPDQRTNQSSDPDQRNQNQSQSAGSEGTQSEYMQLQKRCTDDYDTLTPLYMPLQKGATDVYETIKSSKNSPDDEEGYDDVDLPDTSEHLLILRSYSGHAAPWEEMVDIITHKKAGVTRMNTHYSLCMSHSDDYICQGLKDNREVSKWSERERVKLQVSALPTARVTVEPESSVYVGEKVTLKCEIQSESDWTYTWFKGSSSGHLSQPDTSTLTITAAAKSDESHYWCQGEMRGRAVSSLMSGHVYLAVKDLPIATVTVESPQPPFYPGEKVTLRCDIAENRDWDQYYWSKDGKQIPDQNRKTITISLSNDAGQHTCKGQRGDRPRNSQRSTPVSISVTALPTPTLSVQPETVFTGEDVTLKCEIEPDGVWKYKWYKDGDRDVLSQGDTNTFTIRGAAESHKGQYWCQGERRDRPTSSSHTSNKITIDVKALPTATVTVESPEGPYYPGDEVTLRCDIAEYTDWNWYYWYRGNDNIPNQNSQSITIAHPDQAGQYQFTCEGSRENRPKTSQHSTPVSVSVRAFPVPTLTVKPSNVFTGETVTLTCAIKPSSGWTYQWNILGSIRTSESNSNTLTINRARAAFSYTDCRAPESCVHWRDGHSEVCERVSQ
ncbi:basement membrane-specific heparan sulfate proteoglycan core protein-like [Alosa pseudoharengus]|uniref:basement membrane-specific heparan sulfate proteoglycan core protein-like n=1 Tax=Alosa pseudoharengus TaxID=34774 RepID=UPI003F8BE87D